ncbi:MAG TPA: aminomethyl-transferring glycine dehydrogenase subunit GcvPA [Candidatus Dormibacteraeota bacterium]|jgi:glycine dehydrogenase subunit 1|nr:aminomethyl-transferring glycine dehydrogenase subunit GcvPA [Candidatus Dormibacteraeota bacterium]
MAYLVHADEDRDQMLDAMGASSLEDLLRDIPAELRLGRLDLPEGLSEFETLQRIRALAGRNRVYEDRLTFRGAGVYRHFLPASVAAVMSKPQFATAYTPYQPEASQGTLQAIFEYQTAIAELTALDVANASLYDGATALAEAAVMAMSHTGRQRIAVAPYVHPEYLQVLRCYADGRGFDIVELDESMAIGPETAAVAFQQPDLLGSMIEPAGLVEAAHGQGALAIACVDPISLGMITPPGEYDADIAVGDGQQLGLPPSFGGPHLGFIACRTSLTRRLPGRLVGQAWDGKGRRGFVITLTAREQHIRREKATSNICTNHSLCALGAAVYLSYVGPDGLCRVAEAGYRNAHILQSRLTALAGVEAIRSERPFFSEFAVKVPDPVAVLERLDRAGILGGLPLGRWYPDLDRALLFCCTEVNDDDAIDQVVEVMSQS